MKLPLMSERDFIMFGGMEVSEDKESFYMWNLPVDHSNAPKRNAIRGII